MNELVKAFHASKGPKTYERRINILSLSPYTIPKTMELFNASEYMVKKSRNFKKKYGILPQVPQMSKGKVITPEIKERVEAFFQLDEISRNCPGQKDSLSLRDTEGVKKHFQKRLVLMNLKECFEEYKKDPSNPKIGFSSFASLRPPFCVLAGSSGTHSVCVCTYHQNPKLQLAGLGIKELDYKILLGKTVCDMENRNCMMQQCSLCPGKEGVESFLINTVQSEDIHAQDSQIQYKQWVSTDRCTLEVKVESLEDYINSLSNKIWILTRHHFVSQQQSKYMKELKQNLNEFEAVILGDFSENYSFIVQDAAQGFHWENSQCTLHPFVVYWKDLSKNNALKHISYCALSPETRHNTVMVYSFLKVLLTDLKKRLPQILTIHYFSDGCAGQYKNRYNFSNLCSHEEDFGLQAIWHFFGTGHGKNACDGIGGTVKRSTARASIQRALNYQILNCEDMYTFCTTHLSKSINFFYLKKHDIEVNDIFLKERFENSVTIPGTQKFHKFVPLSKTKIKVFDLSSDIDGQEKFICKAKSLNLKTKPSVSAKIGDFIICSYDERKWVGMVTLFSEEFGDYTVDCMSPSGFCKYYTFPLIKDICLIPEEKVLTILETPSLKQGTTRIQYEFCSKELKKSFSN